MSSVDVAVIGGGITGCALAAFAAEAGASVRLLERDRLAAAASGRNSGVRPAPDGPGARAASSTRPSSTTARSATASSCPAEPAGVLVLGVEALGTGFPELARRAPRGRGADRRSSQRWQATSWRVRLATGYPVPPASATKAFGARARAAGARIDEGAAARVWWEGERAAGVQTEDERIPAGAVVIAAGPWSPGIADPSGRWRPIAPVWGVNVELHLPKPPRHALEEAGVETLMRGAGPPSIFSLVTADGVSALGSTFLPEEPDPAALAPLLLERGARFVPALAGAQPDSVRACARPQAFDGRPLLGALADGLYVVDGPRPVGNLARAGLGAAGRRRGARPRRGYRAGAGRGARPGLGGGGAGGVRRRRLGRPRSRVEPLVELSVGVGVVGGRCVVSLCLTSTMTRFLPLP